MLRHGSLPRKFVHHLITCSSPSWDWETPTQIQQMDSSVVIPPIVQEISGPCGVVKLLVVAVPQLPSRLHMCGAFCTVRLHVKIMANQ